MLLLYTQHEEGSCYIILTRNNCCEFLASYGVIVQSVNQSFLKTPVCGASLTDNFYRSTFHNLRISCWQLLNFLFIFYDMFLKINIVNFVKTSKKLMLSAIPRDGLVYLLGFFKQSKKKQKKQKANLFLPMVPLSLSAFLLLISVDGFTVKAITNSNFIIEILT